MRHHDRIASTGRARIVPSRRHRVVSRTLTTLHRPTRIVSIARVLSRVSTRRRRVVVVAFVRSSRVVPPRVVVASSSFATVSARRRVSRGRRSTDRSSRVVLVARLDDATSTSTRARRCVSNASIRVPPPGRARDASGTGRERRPRAASTSTRRGEARARRFGSYFIGTRV